MRLSITSIGTGHTGLKDILEVCALVRAWHAGTDFLLLAERVALQLVAASMLHSSSCLSRSAFILSPRLINVSSNQPLCSPSLDLEALTPFVRDLRKKQDVTAQSLQKIEAGKHGTIPSFPPVSFWLGHRPF